MARNDKPTNLGLTDEKMTPEQMLAMRDQEKAAELEALRKEAEEKVARANQILEEAKLAAASITVAPAAKKTYSQEANEMAKMTMQKRMETQFGTPDKVKWVHNVMIPMDVFGVEMTMSVKVNGIGYDFQRAETYDMPEDLYEVILRNRYVDSPLVKKARAGELAMRL